MIYLAAFSQSLVEMPYLELLDVRLVLLAGKYIESEVAASNLRGQNEALL
jgi:hypothetical protein